MFRIKTIRSKWPQPPPAPPFNAAPSPQTLAGPLKGFRT